MVIASSMPSTKVAAIAALVLAVILALRFGEPGTTEWSGSAECYGPDESETDPSSQRRIDVDRRALNVAQPRLVPKFTRIGYEHGAMPPALLAKMNAFFDAHRTQKVKERIPVLDYGFGRLSDEATHPDIVQLTPDLRNEIGAILLPIVEEWSGVKAEFTMTYGIRSYNNHTFLKRHVDRIETHVLSVILHLRHDVDRKWPLTIIGHDGAERMLDMQAGDMVLYEGARCVHGRPFNLLGKNWVNAFVHFAPKQWTRGVDYDVIGKRFA